MLFAEAGLSAAQISTLFLVWSTVGIVAEVPSGALADRFSRRRALAAAGVLQALGHVLWVIAPGYDGFAAGFVVWALGGALSSGALEALLYDGLAKVGAEAHYPRVYGRITAVGLLSQVPAAVAATILFSTGGAALVGWASVACCLAAAVAATRLPEAAEPSPAGAHRPVATEDDLGYLATLRSGLREASRSPAVRAALVALAVLGGLDGLEEYFPLLARDWGVPTSVVPLAVLGIPVAGAVGAALGGWASRLRPRTLALLLAAAVALSTAAALVHRPLALLGVAAAYGLYQLVLVVTDSRLQERIEGPARATVTSVAALGAEIGAAVLFVLWALGQRALIAAVVLGTAATLPRLLGPGRTRVEA